MRLLLLLVVGAQLWAQLPVLGRRRAASSGGSVSVTAIGESHTNADASATSIATPATLNIASGYLVVGLVAGTWASASDDVSTFTCGSDAMTRAKAWSSSSSGYGVSLWYKIGASANAAATCTATFAQSVGFRAIAVSTYSVSGGTPTLGLTSCNDAACTALATASTARTAQNVTTTVANSFLVGAYIDWDGNATSTGANSFAVNSHGITPTITSKLVASTGAYPNGSFATAGSSQQYIGLFATFSIQ